MLWCFAWLFWRVCLKTRASFLFSFDLEFYGSDLISLVQHASVVHWRCFMSHTTNWKSSIVFTWHLFVWVWWPSLTSVFFLETNDEISTLCVILAALAFQFSFMYRAPFTTTVTSNFIASSFLITFDVNEKTPAVRHSPKSKHMATVRSKNSLLTELD